MKYQTILLKQFFGVKGVIYYVAIATVIFSHGTISSFRESSLGISLVFIIIKNDSRLRRRLTCLTPSRHSARVCSNPQATDNTLILQQPNIPGLRTVHSIDRIRLIGSRNKNVQKFCYKSLVLCSMDLYEAAYIGISISSRFLYIIMQ